MSETTVVKLSITAGVLLVLSIIFGSQQRTARFEFKEGQILVADLDPGLIAAIDVEKGEDAVRLNRVGKQFLVESKLNYPASNAEVNRLVKDVLNIKLAEEISNDPDAHGELDVAGPGEKTTAITLKDAEGKVLATVFVADAEDGKQYVRLDGSDAVYRPDGFLSFRTTALDYLDKELVNVPRDDIEKVVVAPQDGKVYTILSPEKGKVELQDVPEGKKAKGSEPDGVFGAATWLSFTDFKAAADAQDLSFANTYTVTTRQETEYRFDLAKGAEDKWWVRARARYFGPKELTIEKDATQEQLEEKEKIAKAVEAADAFNQKHQGWVYELSSWKAESMTKPFDQLVEDDDGKPEEVSASHILIPWQGAERAGEDVTRTKEEAQALAEDLLAQVLADPAKLPELAKEHSSCPSAEKGGDLGSFRFETMSKPFSEAAFALEVGAVHPEVVETEFGYHIIQRTK